MGVAGESFRRYGAFFQRQAKNPVISFDEVRIYRVLGAVLGEVGYNGGLCPNGLILQGREGREAGNRHINVVIARCDSLGGQKAHPLILKALKEGAAP